ncbi:Hypothetical predicted protein [Paramuricea clavata]|uniref:DNA 3'-5' helicase n=1 Tax=Paramuricea clavata TaxID=317549 RepID=A0A6S7FPW0_PARCT|nr:Hypothetical predicted protein [Paramuricea clavata]
MELDNLELDIEDTVSTNVESIEDTLSVFNGYVASKANATCADGFLLDVSVRVSENDEWTENTGKKNRKSAFHEAFGRIATIRSFCKEGTPFVALTGTADGMTQRAIITHLSLCNPVKLGKYAYDPQDCQVPENCLIGIYYSLTPQKYKDRIVQSFKGDGGKRIAVTTTALSVGVNFPDVRYIVHWGPPRDLLDYHQKSGHAGRDGLTADVVTHIFMGSNSVIVNWPLKILSILQDATE